MNQLVLIGQQVRRLRNEYDNTSRMLERAFLADPALEAIASRLRPLVAECATAASEFLERLEAQSEYVNARSEHAKHHGQ